MKKSKVTVVKNPTQLAKALGLPVADAVEMEVRSDLNDMIIKAVEKQELTHAQVASLAKTSRSRVTAILNRNTQDVSTDLMLRILASLGYRAKIKFYPAA
jgi:predicted XRE-type DNA-binding protein